MSEDKIYDFVLTGSFYVDTELKPEVCEHEGVIDGFTLKDGRTARLVVALQIEEDDGEVVDYITDENDMKDLGMEFGVYHHAYLEEPQDIDT